jgi:hypothetical protein
MCLGPYGTFTACGETSLWALLQRSLSADSYLSTQYEFAIQYVDRDFLYHSNKDRTDGTSTMKQRKRSRTHYIDVATEKQSIECLLFSPLAFAVGDCSSPQAWKWSIDRHGTLNYRSTSISHNRPSFSSIQYIFGGVFLLYAPPQSHPTKYASDCHFSDHSRHEKPETCTSLECFNIYRCNLSDQSRLLPCHEADTESLYMKTNIVPLSFSPHREGSMYGLPGSRHGNFLSDLNTPGRNHTFTTLTTHTTSHVKAGVYRYTEPHLHPDLKRPTDLLFPIFGRDLGASKKTRPSISDGIITGRSTDTLGTGLDTDDLIRNMLLNHEEHSILHKTRKITTHPYLAVAKNGRYEDPRTGLLYDTDLSDYLGYHHSSKSMHGRQTLMGLGHYYRTVLNIKVTLALVILGLV